MSPLVVSVYVCVCLPRLCVRTHLCVCVCVCVSPQQPKQKKVTLLTPSLSEVAPLNITRAGGDGGCVDDGGVHVFAPPVDDDGDVFTGRSSVSHSPIQEVSVCVCVCVCVLNWL